MRSSILLETVRGKGGAYRLPANALARLPLGLASSGIEYHGVVMSVRPRLRSCATVGREHEYHLPQRGYVKPRLRTRPTPELRNRLGGEDPSPAAKRSRGRVGWG